MARFASLLLGFLLVISATATTGAVRGPSTPEERQRVIDITHKLEASPLDQTLVKERDWAQQLLLEIPDVHLRTCTTLLRDIRRPRYKFRTELWAQVRLAGAAYLIQHPDHADDYVGEHLAGMQSALKAYSAIVKTNPDARSKPLDDLLEKQNEGKLPDVVKDLISVCHF
jgi:hypothetical protein